jgi:multiple sugar transport system permease protein
MTLAAALFVLPFVWMVSTSVKRQSDVFAYPPTLVPHHPLWHNFTSIWHQYPLATWFLNSFFIAGSIVVGQVLTSSLAGFAFAKLRFPGRDRIFFLYLAGLLVPSQVLIVPLFVFVSKLGWVDTPWGLIIPALAGPFGTFLFRQFYLTVSQEYIDAARVDGASTLRIWWSIYLPLSRGLATAFGSITFLIFWNSFIWPLVLLHSENRYTVTLGLASIASAEQFRVPWELVMATSVTSLVPVLLFFAVAQRHIVQGLALSGYADK